jgi:hypothetical protein
MTARGGPNAYVHLQDALADANEASRPVEVRVAQGVYKPDRGANQALGNREATFQLINGVTLRGGFAGLGEPDPNVRDHALHRTILSGDLDGNDVAVADPCDLGVEPTRAENSYHIVTGSGTDATAVLDGFILTAGHADGSPPRVRGAAMHNASGHPTVENCLFTANWAVRRGGAVYNLNSNPTFTHCVFTDNAAGIAGGAIFNGTSNASVTDCVFTRNTAADQGGAMFNNNASPIIASCRFHDNHADWGGAMENFSGGVAVITQCTFRNNTAADQGGGMLNQQASPILTSCIFAENRAGNAGGGIENFADSRPSVSNCTFRGNVAGNLGGGMYNNDAAPTVVNCLFSGNRATFWGGGMENFYGARPLVTNCTFTGNVAGGAGGAMYSHLNCAATLTSCILWANAAPAGPEILDDPNSLAVVAYSLVQGAWPGEGNIDADPCLAAPGRWDPNGAPDDPTDDTWLDGDYHLLPNSPCIDAGDPNFVPDPNHPQTDFYGGPRLTGARIDIGADEYSKYSGGTGEPNDPYQIATAADLIALGETPADCDKHFILIADIDLDPNLPGRKVFDRAVIAPDTNDAPSSWIEGTAFTGVFDGNGRTISHLTIRGGSYLGLFGQLGRDWFRPGSAGQVKNLGVVDVSIIGTGDSVGGLAGYDRSGTVTQCYSSGVVSGRSCVGGLVGMEDSPTPGLPSIIIAYCYSNCYSTAAVSAATRSAGGLVGYNWCGAIIRCYSTGPVSAPVGAGGLVGEGDVIVTDCFWDIETSGQAASTGGTGKTTQEMQAASTFVQWGACVSVWTIDDGRDYPRLAWENAPGQIIAGPTYAGGTGTAEDPYLIATAEDLNALGLCSCHWGRHFTLTADIDLSGRTWTGSVVPSFWGVFDGNGHIISGLTITGTGRLGLFGLLGSFAYVKDLGVVDVNIISSGNSVGGLVGENYGSIVASYSTGAVSGHQLVGGLVGMHEAGDVSRCYSTCGVSGNWDVGGLVGYNYAGTVTQCYSTGSVRGNSSVGGLVGANGGTVTNCYSVGPVSGAGQVGGLVGWGGATACFWDIQTSGQASSDGGTAKTTGEMKVAKTFLDAGWDFVGETANGTEDLWWILEGKDYPRLWWEAAKK